MSVVTDKLKEKAEYYLNLSGGNDQSVTFYTMMIILSWSLGAVFQTHFVVCTLCCDCCASQ
uniref:Uncharacterized protein n=1 Tax=Denticeps clupeoides TaxID=299321 RepID=A0AAY3ZY55_9TELE